MDHIDIELFLSIVKHSSITKAAEALHFSQSTVSYRVNLLEKELGIKLFHRKKGSRNLELTQAGQLFIPIAKRWMAVYQDTSELKTLPRNTITIGAVNSISASVLSDAYRAVSEGENPLRVEVITGYSQELYNMVDNNRIDIGFIAEPATMKNVITIPLFRQQYYIVRYTKRPVPMRRIALDTLDPKDEIYVYWGEEYERWHEQIWGTLPQYHASVDNASLLKRFLTDEKYWAIIPGSLLQTFASGGASMQIDEMDLEEQPYRICYMVKNSSPKASKTDNIHRFEQKMIEILADIPGLELLK